MKSAYKSLFEIIEESESTEVAAGTSIPLTHRRADPSNSDLGVATKKSSEISRCIKNNTRISEWAGIGCKKLFEKNSPQK